MRLQENRDGFDVYPFPELGVMGAVAEDTVKSSQEDSDDEESPEQKAERERVEWGALRNSEDMDLDVFSPVWMRRKGYPGEMHVGDEGNPGKWLNMRTLKEDVLTYGQGCK